jgi:ATP-binding cassette subfamily B protein
MYGRANMVVMRGFRMDPSITKQKLKPGTIRRIAAYARPYRMYLAVFLLATAVDAVITVVNPLLLRDIIDQGILGRNEQLVVLLACAVAVVAIFDAALGFVIRWFSARIGEGLIYDLRTQVFDHVQRRIAFFTRADRDPGPVTRRRRGGASRPSPPRCRVCSPACSAWWSS